MAWVTPSNVVTGDVLTASTWNQDVVANTIALPGGVLFHSGDITSSFATSATHTTYQTRTGMSGSVSYAADRYLRVLTVLRLYPGGGLQGIKVQFRRGSTVIAQNFIDANQLNAFSATAIVLEWVFVGPNAAASETFDVQIAAGLSNTAVNDAASATYPSFFYVEDCGAV